MRGRRLGMRGRRLGMRGRRLGMRGRRLGTWGRGVAGRAFSSGRSGLWSTERSLAMTLPSGLTCASTARLSPTHAVVRLTLPLSSSAFRWHVTAVVPDCEQSSVDVHAQSCSTYAAVIALCRFG